MTPLPFPVFPTCQITTTVPPLTGRLDRLYRLHGVTIWNYLHHLGQLFPVRLNTTRRCPMALIESRNGHLMLAEYEFYSPTLNLIGARNRTLMTRDAQGIQTMRPLASEVAIQLLAQSYGLPIEHRVARAATIWRCWHFTATHPLSVLALAEVMTQARAWQQAHQPSTVPPVLVRQAAQQRELLIQALQMLAQAMPDAFQLYQPTPTDTRLFFRDGRGYEPLAQWSDLTLRRISPRPVEIALRTLVSREASLTYIQKRRAIACRLKVRGQPPVVAHGATEGLALAQAIVNRWSTRL